MCAGNTWERLSGKDGQGGCRTNAPEGDTTSYPSRLEAKIEKVNCRWDKEETELSLPAGLSPR
jgi:hypothetical protein